MEDCQKCIVCGSLRLQSEPPRTLVLDAVTEHTTTPLREVVGSALQKKLKLTDHICMKCYDLFNEKDKLQKMTTDMESHIMTKIKDSSNTGFSTQIGSISIVVGESFNNDDIKKKLETQYKNMKVMGNLFQPSPLLTQEKDEPPPVTTKKRRGRPPKLKKPETNKEEKVSVPPPLMVTQREKRKRSTRFNTFLEVLKGEKEFYIEDEDVEEPKTARKRGGGRKKKVATVLDNIFYPAEEETKGDDIDKMCIIQVTDPDIEEGVSHITDKDRLDLDEVVQEILGIETDAETSLMQDMETLHHNENDLIDVMDEINSRQADSNSCLKKSVVLPNQKLEIEISDINLKYDESETNRIKKTSELLPETNVHIQEIHIKEEGLPTNWSGTMVQHNQQHIKEEGLLTNWAGTKVQQNQQHIKEEGLATDWSCTKVQHKQVIGNLNMPSIEVTEIEEDLAASMPSLEVTITQSEDNTLSAVVNDPDVLSALIQEDFTDTLVSAIKQEGDSNISNSEQRKYRCKLCSIIFVSKQDAREHAQVCRTVSEKVENDRATNRKSYHKNYKCFDCDRTFPTSRGRDRHHLHMHLKHKPVQCLECFRTFNSFRPLERHLRNDHDKDPTLFCELCEAEFVMGTSLEHHKEIVHPVANKPKVIKVPVNDKVKEPVKQTRVFECPFCHEEIYGARALRVHHQVKHNGQEYTCKYCKYKCACLSTMHRHMVRVHKALNLKLYNCFKCSAGYQDPRDLEEHYITVHDTKAEHLCQHCGDKFACLDMLRFHRKSHRAFSCKLCFLGFMKEEALEDHMKTVHTCDPVGINEKGDISSLLAENESSTGEMLDQADDDMDGNDKDYNLAVSSKVLVIASDGTVQVKEETKEVCSTVPAVPSEDVTLHLQQTREGGLEEMDMLNPLKGHKVKDLPKKMNCPICNKVLTTKFLKTHMLSHKGNLPHKCHVCCKAYAQGTLLRKHMKNRHPEEFLKMGNKNPKKHKIQCEFCPSIYDNIYTLEEHLWEHMTEKVYECEDCKIKFGMARNLREHYKSHFFKEAQPCPVCKREFKSIGFFNEHVERCQNRWKCEQCDMECETQEYYRKHQRAEHGGENVVKYKCSLCEKSFVERFRYDDHMITHSSEKAYMCHICNKQFKRQRPLNDHLIRAHSEGKPTCHFCEKTFSTQQELDEHKRKHRKKFSCTTCSHVYTSREALTNHLMVHHSEASYPCHICGQSFAKQYNLKTHLITHSSNTPHICHADGCHKMFKSENLLRNHVARRHFEIHYDCPVCDRRFGLESDQIRHLTTHSEGVGLHCSECGRLFHNEAQLERHMLTHTHEKPYECGLCQHRMTSRNHLLHHIQGQHGLTEVTPHLVVNRWRCSVCGKMFVLKGSLMRHLQDHATQGVEAQGHAIKTRSTPSMLSEVSVSSTGTSDAATATNAFLDQVSTLSWQDITPLLRLHVVADEESSEGVGTAAVAADVWQCPGCLQVTQTEEEMRDHLVVTSQCQEAVILHLADGLTNTEDLDGDGATEEEQLLNENRSGTVLQLTGSDGGMQYVIVQEEDDDGLAHRLSGGNKVTQSVQERDDGMQVLVSMEDSLQHLLGERPAHPDIQIVVEDSAPLKQLLAESGGGGGEQHPSAVTNAASTTAGQDNVASDTSILNGSEVLLQTADGRLVLQQIVGGVTQYQLVEGVSTAGEEEEETSTQIQLVESGDASTTGEDDVISEALIPAHSSTLDSEFMLS